MTIRKSAIAVRGIRGPGPTGKTSYIAATDPSGNLQWMKLGLLASKSDVSSGGVSPPIFTATTNGIVPASGGGALNFLRADGTWAAPASASGGIDLYAPPLAASFTTWSGDGTNPVLTDVTGLGMVVDSGALSTTNILRGCKAALPGATYTISSRIRGHVSGALAFLHLGLVLTDGTGYIVFGKQARQPDSTSINRYTNATTFSATSLQVTDGDMPEYWQITNDGTHRNFLVSADGRNWLRVFQEATGAFLTETSYGFYFGTPTSTSTAHAFIACPWLTATTP